MVDSINESRISYLYEAARCGTIRGAAESLEVGPSAVSRQIVILEQELAVSLLDRTSQGVKPTEAGKLVLEYFREQRSHQSDLLFKLQEIRGLRRGSIAVCMGEGFVSDMVAGPIKQFCQKYPDISLTLDLAGTNDVVNAVVQDVAEIGLLYNPPPEPKIVSRAISRQPMYAVVGPDFPLLGKVASVTMRDLLKYPVALTHPNYGARQLVDAAAMMEKIRLTPIVSTNSFALLKHFVKSGLGYTLLPPFSVRAELSSGELFKIPVDNPLLSGSEAHLITHVGRKLSAAANRLLQHLTSRMHAFQEG